MTIPWAGQAADDVVVCRPQQRARPCCLLVG